MFVFLTFTTSNQMLLPQIAATGKTPDSVLDVAKKKGIVCIHTTLDQVLINGNENHKELIKNRAKAGFIVLASKKAYKVAKKLIRIEKSNQKQIKDMSSYLCALMDFTQFEYIDEREFPLYLFMTAKEKDVMFEGLKKHANFKTEPYIS